MRAGWEVYLAEDTRLGRKVAVKVLAEAAAAEFQNTLDHRGAQPTSPAYSFAQLGLARAAALNGDTLKARAAYQHFLGGWTNADSDLRILLEIKKEYANL